MLSTNCFANCCKFIASDFRISVFWRHCAESFVHFL